MKRCLLCLQELPVFTGLARNEFVNVCLSAAKKQLDKGTTLFNQGDRLETVYLIKAGKIKIVRATESGRELILDVLGPGEVLGETALFQAQEQPFSAVTLETAKLCCFSRRHLEELVRQNPEFAVKIISALGRKLYNTLEQLGEAALLPVREKLLLVFSRLAAEYGRDTPAGTLIEVQLTQQDLADMVGASRVMVAQVLQELKEASVVSREGRYYVLLKDRCLGKHFD
ncbi:hypothetical protein SY88_22855 [Clostridiales bacterium PH28_bin88]|nr:hypothetical protein SY88_22855 [Clostridiales bacterium PH28_bin88]